MTVQGALGFPEEVLRLSNPLEVDGEERLCVAYAGLRIASFSEETSVTSLGSGRRNRALETLSSKN
jgi:hypothetical protein